MFQNQNKPKISDPSVVVVNRSNALLDMLAEIGTSNKNGEPDIQTISSIAKKYGIEFLN